VRKIITISNAAVGMTRCLKELDDFIVPFAPGSHQDCQNFFSTTGGFRSEDNSSDRPSSFVRPRTRIKGNRLNTGIVGE